MAKSKNRQYIITILLFIVISTAITVHFFKKNNNNELLKNSNFARGWQLKIPPTDTLKAGTIYRVNEQGFFYLVKTLSVPSSQSLEGSFTYSARVLTTRNAIAKYLRLGEVSGNLDKKLELTLELKNVVRDITTDESVDKALKGLWDKVRIRSNEKYFIIRETRAATQILCHLNKDVVSSLGGKANIKKAANTNATVKEGGQGSIIIQDKYERSMYIMYLPEEIKITTAGFNNEVPQFGLFSVSDILEWNVTED